MTPLQIIEALDNPPLKRDQPDYDTMRRTIEGKTTAWTFDFDVPPVCTVYWNTDDWIRYIGNNWRRKVGPNWT